MATNDRLKPQYRLRDAEGNDHGAFGTANLAWQRAAIIALDDTTVTRDDLAVMAGKTNPGRYADYDVRAYAATMEEAISTPDPGYGIMIQHRAGMLDGTFARVVTTLLDDLLTDHAHGKEFTTVSLIEHNGITITGLLESITDNTVTFVDGKSFPVDDFDAVIAD